MANGQLWKYLDDGADPGLFSNTALMDDSGWSSGVEELGYGDNTSRRG